MLQWLTFTVLVGGAPLAQAGDPTFASTILEALRLPALVTEARGAGVPETAVRQVLDALRRRGVGADEAALVVREEVAAVNAGAPRDNFGAFVQAQLDAGLRGRALAEAIRKEHRARGIGRPGDDETSVRSATGARGKKP